MHGGIFFPQERHLDPRAFVRELHRNLVGRGVRIVEDAPVTRVETRDAGGTRRVVAVHTAAGHTAAGHTAAGHTATGHTATGRVEADAVVLATGAWSGHTAELFGRRLPVRPGKGYSVDVAPLPLRSPTNLSDVKVAVTPFADRLRLAGTMEFAGLDEDVNQVRVAAILRGPKTYLRGWATPTRSEDGQPLRPVAGMRPMTPDGLPAIGALPGLGNAYVSTGHGMLGVTLAPGSARALTELVLSGRRPEVLAPFDPARF